MQVGPANPKFKGLREVLSPNLIRQTFEDGFVYQLSVRKGSVFGVINAHTWKIPADHLKRAEWLCVYEPDEWQDDDDRVYLSLWVAAT